MSNRKLFVAVALSMDGRPRHRDLRPRPTNDPFVQLYRAEKRARGIEVVEVVGLKRPRKSSARGRRNYSCPNGHGDDRYNSGECKRCAAIRHRNTKAARDRSGE